MMGARLHVCFVLPSLNGGGAERAAVKIMNALDSTRFARSMYVFRREGRYVDDVSPEVTLVAASHDTRWSRIAQLAGYLRSERPDVVVCFLSYFSAFVAALLSGRFPRVVVNQQTPMSAFLRDRDYHWHRPVQRRVFERVVRAIYPRMAAVVATSPGVAADLTTAFHLPAERERARNRACHRSRIASAALQRITSALPPAAAPEALTSARYSAWKARAPSARAAVHCVDSG